MSADLQALLLTAMQSGGNPRDLLIQQALQNADPNEPVTALLTQMLARRQNDDDAIEQREDDTREHIDRLTELLRDSNDTLARVYSELEDLRNERELLYARIEDITRRHATVAAALGVCESCLGDDENCPMCAGRGYSGSGFYRPDPELFRYYVAPALQLKRELSRGDLAPQVTVP